MMDETENLGENETIEISNMKCELNILSRSHGSALLSVGKLYTYTKLFILDNIICRYVYPFYN